MNVKQRQATKGKPTTSGAKLNKPAQTRETQGIQAATKIKREEQNAGQGNGDRNAILTT